MNHGAELGKSFGDLIADFDELASVVRAPGRGIHRCRSAVGKIASGSPRRPNGRTSVNPSVLRAPP